MRACVCVCMCVYNFLTCNLLKLSITLYPGTSILFDQGPSTYPDTGIVICRCGVRWRCYRIRRFYNLLRTVYSCTSCIVHCTSFTVHCTLYIVHSTLYIIHCRIHNECLNRMSWIVRKYAYLYCVHCTVYDIHCKLYSVQFVHCTVDIYITVHCILWYLHCTVYIVQCTTCSVHCIMYTEYCISDHSHLISSPLIRITMYTVM